MAQWLGLVNAVEFGSGGIDERSPIYESVGPGKRSLSFYPNCNGRVLTVSEGAVRYLAVVVNLFSLGWMPFVIMFGVCLFVFLLGELGALENLTYCEAVS